MLNLYFTIPNTPIVVQPQLWSQVADSLVETIRITIDTTMDPGNCTYTSNFDHQGHDSLRVDRYDFFRAPSPVQSRWRESLFVHEMMHAMFDRNHLTISHRHNEAAGYITQTMYLALTNVDSYSLMYIQDPQKQFMFAKAWDIAIELLATNNRTLSPSWMPTFTDLQNLIAQLPMYAGNIDQPDTEYDGIDGVPEWLTL